MRNLFLIIIMGIAICASSCGGNINCRDEAISLAFNGYDTLSLSTVVLKKFKKGTDFTQQIDSVISGTNSSQITVDSEGTILNNLTYGVMNADYDYTIYITKVQRTYKIRGITYHQVRAHTSCKLCENDCVNNCSYYINDSLINHTGSIYDRLYLHITR